MKVTWQGITDTRVIIAEYATILSTTWRPSCRFFQKKKLVLLEIVVWRPRHLPALVHYITTYWLQT